jgi:hypothetical protein
MQRAHGRNAAVKGKFFFRRHMAPLEPGDDGFGEQYASMFSRAVNGKKGETLPTIPSEGTFNRLDTNATDTSIETVDGGVNGGDGVSAKRRVAPNASGGPEENSYEEMTMAEIMTGKGGTFEALLLWSVSCYYTSSLVRRLLIHQLLLFPGRLLSWSDSLGLCLP